MRYDIPVDPAHCILVADNRGTVGSAVLRAFLARGCENLLLRTRAEVDPSDPAGTLSFLEREWPKMGLLTADEVRVC